MGHAVTVPNLFIVAILPAAHKLGGMLLNRVFNAIYDDHSA
jgi:hypothetical protein